MRQVIKLIKAGEGRETTRRLGRCSCAQLDKNTQNHHATQAISMVALQLYGYKQVAVSICGYVVGKIHSYIKPVLV